MEWWQASTDGNYAYSSYNLRGNFHTDAEGRVEILTIMPGAYGPVTHIRAGHFHLMITGGPKCDEFTTQMYVCAQNNKDLMNSDLYVVRLYVSWALHTHAM